MDKEEFLKKIFEADFIAGKFADKAGLEKNLKFIREAAESFEGAMPESSRGAFNLMMCYVYKPFRKLPGIARFCNEQTKYFLNRAKMYGIEIPKNKRLPGKDLKQLPGE